MCDVSHYCGSTGQSEAQVSAGAMPRVVDGHDRVVMLSTYLEKTWPCVPFAIPSRSRENDLCDQTLSLLRAYDYDLSAVHIFVDATIVRPDGTNEYDEYYTCLRQKGLAKFSFIPEVGV